MSEHNPKRRDEILDVARQLFAEHGFAQTTTRVLNSTIGIADGLLYYYFPQGKQQLLDTIVQDGAHARMNAVAVDLHAAQTPEKLENVLMHLFETMWRTFSEPVGYQVFLITVRERHLLSPTAASWLNANALHFEVALHSQLTTLAWLALDDEACQQFAQTCLNIVQSALLQDLLLNDLREVSRATMAKSRAQLHFLIGQAAQSQPQALQA